MATRIDIELTSRQDDGRTFTWRAVGARQPKGSADATLFPEGSAVGDAFKVEAEMDLDGIRVVAVVPPKEKESRPKGEVLQLLGSDDGPLVTQQLVEGNRRGSRDGGRGRSRPDRDRSGGDKRGDRHGGERRDDRAGRERARQERPRTPAKPKLPPKPKPPRLKAGRTHRNAFLESLSEEEKAVAKELLGGGLQVVRQGLAKQNDERRAAGESPIAEGPLMTLAERLLVQVRAAEWRDRADAALEQADVVDLRDLRSVVTASDGAAKDDETRALAARIRSALTERLEVEQQAWVQEVVEMLDDDRVVRALHLSSRPPKAGAPLPAPVALRLVEASSAAMSADITAERWTHVLEALALSPVRRQVVPVSLPTTVSDELKATIARFGSQLPEIAQIFGIEPVPAGRRSERRRRPKPAPTNQAGTRERTADQPGPAETVDETPTETPTETPSEIPTASAEPSVTPEPRVTPEAERPAAEAPGASAEPSEAAD